MGKFDTHGGYFAPKDFFRINTGGSHEENPNGGVQVGMDQNGIPNLLEEGEPVYDDYVFSDNIYADSALLEKYNIPSKYSGKLYSEIADSYVDEAEERPNDPISNNGLKSMLGRLSSAQEEQKQIKEQQELEDELANLSPEELAELEEMLAQSEQQQVEEPMLEQNIESMPVMACGGKMRKYDIGGGIVNPSIVVDKSKKLPVISTPPLNSPLSNTLANPQIKQQQNNYSDFIDSLLYEDTNIEPLPTYPRYAGALTSGIIGQYNAFQKPDEYTIPDYSPVLPTGKLNLIDPVYNLVDPNLVTNDVLASGSGTVRDLMNSGLGPSTGAAVIAADSSIGKNLGAGRAAVSEVNDKMLNNTIQGYNNNRTAESQFDYALSKDRVGILNDAKQINAERNLMRQKLNYDAEAQKYAALSNQIDQVAAALSGIGQENFNMNAVRTNPAFDYVRLPDGRVAFVPKRDDSTLLFDV